MLAEVVAAAICLVTVGALVYETPMLLSDMT
jgi:hypothetical protein